MTRIKKLGLGLFSLLAIASLLAAVVPAAKVNASHGGGHETAYQSGNTIKFRNVIYQLAGEDTRSDSSIQGWSIYTVQGDTFSCGDNIIVDNPANSDTVALRDTQTDNQDDPSPVLGPDCVTVNIDTQPWILPVTTQALCTEAGGDWSGSTCTFNSTPSQQRPASETPPGETVDGANPETEDNNTCESRSGGMGWILCSGIDLIDGSLTWIDSQIQRLLEIDEDKYTNPTLKRGWATFRNIAYIILIPIMLVMVIGTALGFEVFSAYTIKKALPRMVIAVIFITLSWYFCTALITISNVVGGGILGLVTAPFRDTMTEPACQDGALNLACQFSVGNDYSNWTTILRTVATTAANVGLIIGLLIFLVIFGISIVAAAIGGFIVLVVRQMLIIALILMAPLAILAWIFPGNDKPWNFWWSLFSKLLIMFPLIMFVIAIGRVFAWLINISDEGGFDGWALQPVMKLFAYMLPYALIPLTFKFAGGLMANIAGVVNNPQRGLVDRAKNLRNAGFKRAHETLKTGTGARTGLGKEGIMGGVGGAYRRVAYGGRHGSLSRSAAGKSRWEMYERKQRDAIAAKAAEEDQGVSLNNDDMTDAIKDAGLSGGNKQTAVNLYAERKMAAKMAERAAQLGVGVDDLSEAERNSVRSTWSPEIYQDAIQSAEQFEQYTGLKIGTDPATVLSQRFRTASTNTAYEANEAGALALQNDLKALQDKGLISKQDAATWVKSNRGRTDWSAAGFNEAAQFASGEITAKEFLKRSTAGAESREVLGGHTRAAETFATMYAEESRVAQHDLDVARNSGASEEVIIQKQAVADKAAANLESVMQQMRYTSPKKADFFSDKVLSQPIKYSVKEEEEVVVMDTAGKPQIKMVRTGNIITNPSTGKQEPEYKPVYDDKGQPVYATRKTGKYVWRQKEGTHRQMLEETKRRVLSEGVKLDAAGNRVDDDDIYAAGRPVYGTDSRMADRGQGGYSSYMEGDMEARERDRIEMEEQRRREEEK